MTPLADPFTMAAEMLLAGVDRGYVPHAEWCRTHLPHVFPLPYGPHHRELFDGIRDTATGVRAFVGAPRGSGKTSAAVIGLPISAAAQGTHRFIVIIRGDQTAANAGVEMIRAEIDGNPDLVDRWPALKPRKRTRVDRAEKDTMRELRLAGATIVGLGAGAKIRGLLRRGPNGEMVRPDLVIVDIEESADQARSKLRTDRLEEWLLSDVAQLGTMEHPMDLVAIGTTIDTDALVTRAVRGKGRFASWRHVAYPAEIVDENGDRVAAWPEGQPLSALDRLLDPTDPLFVGTFTYAKEYLLDPRRRTDARISAEWLRFGRAPNELSWRAIGIDPAASEKAVKDEDWSAIVDVGMDPHGRVWVPRFWRGHVSSRRLFDVAEDFATDADGNQIASIAFEAVAGFAWGLQELRRRGLGHRGVTPRTDKVSRFETVALLFEAGLVWFDESLRDSDLVEELLDFPGGEHDDLVDALFYATMLATNAGRRAMKQREAS